jgi:hypothetical protein
MNIRMVQTRIASRHRKYPLSRDNRNQGLRIAKIFRRRTARNAGLALPINSSVEFERKSE